MKILIIEDEYSIYNNLKKEVESYGYEVDGIDNFNNIVNEFLDKKPHLILMDIVLPYNNGYYWCQEIRKISTVPIIFISSKSENMDIVMGVQFGGDDYITKPLDMNLVMAKIKAVLRRSYDFTNQIDFFSFDDVFLFFEENKLKYMDKEISLTNTENNILQVIFKAKGSVATREAIMEKCWHGDDYIDDNTLAVNMVRLRKKLSSIGLDELIQTKKGKGYYLKQRKIGENNE